VKASLGLLEAVGNETSKYIHRLGIGYAWVRRKNKKTKKTKNKGNFWISSSNPSKTPSIYPRCLLPNEMIRQKNVDAISILKRECSALEPGFEDY
jgi:hypothetical protein